MGRRSFLLTRRDLIASLALTARAVASRPTTVSPQTAPSGGTPCVAFEADITGRDPFRSLGIQAGYVHDNLYNNLVTIDASMNIVPDLAESWEVQKGGRVYVFRLYPGVQFHHGTTCSAGGPGLRYRFYLPGRSARFIRNYTAPQDIASRVAVRTF